MKAEVNIDYEKSLSTKRLHIKPLWLEYFDMSAIVMIGAAFVIYPLLLFDSADMNSPNDSVIAYSILPLAILFGIAIIYKKMTEKKLTTISTGIDKKRNRELILVFMKSKGYKVITSTKNLIIAEREEDIMSWPRQVNVLLDAGVFYVCVLTLSAKARVPSFFTSKSIIKDLQKFIATESLTAARHQAVTVGCNR